MPQIRRVLAGAKTPARHETFDEITVGRIDIVEPDGTKRIILSNKAQFPGEFQKGSIRRFGAESGKLPDTEQRAYWKKLSGGGRLSENRIWLGNTRDKGSALRCPAPA